MDYTISELLNRVIYTNQNQSGSYYQDVAWIQDILDKFLAKKPSSKVADLSDDDKGKLLKLIIKGYKDNNKMIPEYLSTNFDTSTAELTTTLPSPTIATQLGNEVGMKLESVEDYQVALHKVVKKFEVSKNFLKDLDNKLSKYESLNFDDVVEKLEAYESIGTIDEIEQLIELADKHESLGTIEEVEKLIEVAEQPNFSSKSESSVLVANQLAKYESLGTVEEVEQLLAIATKYESLGTPDEVEKLISVVETELEDKTEAKKKAPKTDKTKKGEDMSKVTTKVEDFDEDNMTDEELLEAYRELGSLSEIQDLMDAAEELDECNTAKTDELAEMTDKVESIKADLVKYESIGTTDEILGIVTQYADTKMKMESERISKDLGIPQDRVLDAIDKMESIREAEDFLVSLFPKTESKVVDKTESEVTSRFGKSKFKFEDSNRLPAEPAKVVTAKMESDSKTKLKQICAKL